MKKSFVCCLTLIISLASWSMDAAMYQWRSHFAYGEVTSVVDADDKIYGLAGNAIFSVDKASEEVQTYAKQDGLNGGDIAQIAYDEASKTFIIAYNDGLIDFIHNSRVTALNDLQQKALTYSKQPNKIVIRNGLAYCCMPFGIMVVDINQQIIRDTYYIGDNGKEVNILDLAFSADSVFAISANTLFSVSQDANMMDYVNWNRMGNLPNDSSYRAIAIWKEELFVVAKNTFAQRKGNSWYCPKPDWKFMGLRVSNNQLFVIASGEGIFSLGNDFSIQHTASPYVANDICMRNQTYWLATSQNGIVRQTAGGTQSFMVNGPIVNIPYRMRFMGEKMIMVPGGYYVTSTKQDGNVMVYQDETWSNFSKRELMSYTGLDVLRNMCDAIIDPNDPNHYFAASLGMGLWEFRDNKFYKWYYSDNSFLDNIATPTKYYTWVDAFAYDSQGNLWMINLANTRNIKVLMPDGNWAAIDNDITNKMQRAREMLIWNQNENIKIIACNHEQRGIVVLNDNGTITYSSDDNCIFRTEFVDQDNNTIQLEELYSIAQTKEGALWIGTNKGIVIVDDPSSLFTSNVCRKIKIPRNDGTNLADYLLDTEQINAIVVDGANRKWIGTATSGLYLISEDGLETIHHFNTDNSPLIDNCIISLAIQPSTGRLFVGTGKGLMSYQSDAAPAEEDYSNVYAYPNPVRPDFEGVITIRGLMDESIVHIVDNAGNLVCETRSNGGLAIWDGKTADGKRAASGVYSVYLNENNEGKHAVTKILIMH